MSGTPYPGLERVSDPAIKAVLKAVFDKIGNVEAQVPAIGSVSQPLTTHLNANSNQLQAVADPTHPQDAVTLKYLQHYVESRVTTQVQAAVASVTPPGATPPPGAPSTPTPPPPPVGPPTSTSGFLSATDMLNLSLANLQSSPPDIATWPITTTITSFTFTPASLDLEFSKKSGGSRWPDYPPPGWTGPIQYTLWLFLHLGGTWYGAGAVLIWFGETLSGIAPSGIGTNPTWWLYAPALWGPMVGYQPAVGESVGFMVSAGDARTVTTVTSVQERSQVIVVPFPSDSGGMWTS